MREYGGRGRVHSWLSVVESVLVERSGILAPKQKCQGNEGDQP